MPIGEVAQKEALRVLKKVLKPAAKIIASTILKQATGYSIEGIKEILLNETNEDKEDLEERVSGATKEASEKIGGLISETLKSHKTIKESIRQFKENLSQLIEHLEKVEGVQLPILIFVDELDRCRPDYAIELLEGIKHLFGVPGVTFVVATNIPQLSESIKAIYGAGFDGQRYLQRFFDLQYTLARPDNKSFSQLALEKISGSLPDNVIYGLEREHRVHPRTAQNEICTTLDALTLTLSFHADNLNLSLRDIAQITIMLEASFIALKNESVHIFFLVFLLSIYKIDPVLFKKIHREKTIQNNKDYELLVAKGERTNLVVSEFDQFGSQRSNSTSLSLTEIIDCYFTYLESRDFNNFGREIFPIRNFDAGQYNKKQAGGNYIAPFEKYFAIVEQAGGFILKKK